MLPALSFSVRNALALGALALSGCAVTDAMFRAPERSGPLVNGEQTGRWTFRYPGGEKKAEGSYVRDKQVGRWTYWYANGNVEWEGGFSDQRIAGPCLFGYENGQRRAVGHFVDGFEEDLWTFWNPQGGIDQEGDYARGRPVLRWSYFHPDGSLAAQGFRLDGERVGLWQFYSTDGELAERRFPLPDGVEVVHETWPDGVPRREGFVVNGVPTGRWVTWHANGRRRMTCDLVNGEPSGLVLSWSDTGEPLAVGRAEAGSPVGTWTAWRRGQEVELRAREIPAGSFDGQWSREGSPGNAIEPAIGRWLAEVRAPIGGPVDQTPNPDTPAPSTELAERTAETPSVPMRAQPWTVRESEALEFLVARYSDGARNVRPPARSAYGSRRGRERGPSGPETGDPELSPKFLGTELPWTRFYTADAQVVDLDEFRGKKKVVLVVLRGFAREVCVYCVTQTEALCDHAEEFRALGSEVFVVYPGEKNRLEAFLESFQAVSKRMGEPPIGVLYDPNMQLVERMGITAELAIPSTFVIDESGRIRYSYVGQAIDDRPPAEDVLAAIRELPSS